MKSMLFEFEKNLNEFEKIKSKLTALVIKGIWTNIPLVTVSLCLGPRHTAITYSRDPRDFDVRIWRVHRHERCERRALAIRAW